MMLSVEYLEELEYCKEHYQNGGTRIPSVNVKHTTLHVSYKSITYNYSLKLSSKNT